MESVENLLLQSDEIVRRHEEQARLRGEDFNVFEILDRATDEVQGHSAVLACLLDPKGAHGQGTIFLNLFMKAMREVLGQHDPGRGAQYSLPRFEEALAGEMVWTVSRELTLPTTDVSGGMSLGRIDLLIKGANTVFIVENKIYAADQDYQLQRYHDYAAAMCWPHVYLIYLTLDGSEPSTISLGSLDRESVLRLDYGGFVLGWIENCIEAVALLPHIRETLYQYRRLLQRLTQWAGNREMTMEIAKLVRRNAEMLGAALAVEGSLPQAKAEVQLAFWRKLEDALRERLGEEGKRLTATYNEDKVRTYYAAARGAEKWFGLTLPLSMDRSAPVIGLDVLVEQNLYYAVYGLQDDHDGPMADESLRTKVREVVREVPGEWTDATSGRTITWRYPSAEWRLNFRRFDGNCVRLADACGLDRHVAGVVEDVFLVWQKLQTICG